MTGASGFVGTHLRHRLAEEPGATVFACDVSSPKALDGEEAFSLDVTEAEAVQAAFAEMRPDVVYHLAAISQVADAENDQERCWKVNVDGVQSVLDGLSVCESSARLVLASSAEVYGKSGFGEEGITEDSPPMPATTYALTKSCAELLGMNAVHRGLDVVILRPFNHVGPGQSEAFVVSAFARQIAQIESGQQEPILRTGNLDARRDFMDVSDMVEAYLLAAQKARPGVPYNVTSGDCRSIQSVLDDLLVLSDATVTVEQDPDRMRPSDVPVFHGSAKRFEEETGWQCRVPLNETLESVLDYWRVEVNPKEDR